MRHPDREALSSLGNLPEDGTFQVLQLPSFKSSNCLVMRGFPMAAVRTFWKGHMRLALVTIPIRLVSATSTEETVSFHQVDRNTKQRIRYQKVAGENGPKVNSKDIVHGYEVEPGNYVLFDNDELDALKLASRHTVELTEFVDADAIDPVYYDRPYFILPDGEVAEEGYCVIRDALASAKKYGIGQIAMRGRENLVALRPVGNGLMLETLRYANEVRDADDIFSGIGQQNFRPGLIEMATQLIEERTTEFDPGAHRDHYTEAVRELVRSKLEGGEAVAVGGGTEAPAGGGTVIDFMEALKRSVEKAPAKKPARAAPKRAAAASKRDPVKHDKGSERQSSRTSAGPRSKPSTTKKKA